MIAPAGPVYQAGTLSGNPLAMAAGIATLNALTAPGLWEFIVARTTQLSDSLNELAQAAGIPFKAQDIGTNVSSRVF